MKTDRNEYEYWRKEERVEPYLQEELASILGNEEAIREAFYRDLKFGTSGVRGKMGAGTNRMNVHVIDRLTQGISEYLKAKFENPSCVIGHDSRNRSKEFADRTAEVLIGNGVKVHFFREIVPVAGVSYAVRNLNASLGIMITASHNPKEYNGYKVYNSTGGQILKEEVLQISEKVNEIPMFEGVERGSLTDKLLFEWVDDGILNGYISDSIKGGIPSGGEENLSIIYTPLNGAGYVPVTETLKKAGFIQVETVPSQREADGNFPTCPYPNPENAQVYDEAKKICREKSCDIIIANDPDCDRVGVVVRDMDSGDMTQLTGNAMGSLIFDYMCRMKDFDGIDGVPVVFRTIVSTPMIDRIAEAHGVSVRKTLIGFKYIVEEMDDLGDRFVFGFEEALGFLVSNHVRDKDGVSGSLMLAQVAAFHKKRGYNLCQALAEIQEKYGICGERALNFVFEGYAGNEKMAKIMDIFRFSWQEDIFQSDETSVVDYLCNDGCETGFPRENILEFNFENGSKLVIRPSGTEPKIKVYMFAEGDTPAKAERILDENEKKVRKVIESVG